MMIANIMTNIAACRLFDSKESVRLIRMTVKDNAVDNKTTTASRR